MDMIGHPAKCDDDPSASVNLVDEPVGKSLIVAVSLPGTWCLDSREALSPDQAAQFARVHKAYPDVNNDPFVVTHREQWLSG
jgi:hypothetical protein